MTSVLTKSGLFGDLFHDPAMAVMFSAETVLTHILAFERAWTQALAATGIISAETQAAALAAIDAYHPDLAALGRASDIDGVPIPALGHDMRALLPDDHRAGIHSGATSQDVLDTAIVLSVKAALALCAQRGVAVLKRLDHLAQTQGQNTVMARTRMQAARPITVADRVAVWRRALATQLEHASAVTADLSMVQIGGAVGLRDLPEDRGEAVAAHVANTLGLAVGPVWHADRARIVAVGHWLTQVSGALGKMGQDIALMAQQGIDEVKLTGAGGSSAMPHKQNPIRAEALVALARYTAGQQGVLAQALIHEQERSGAAWALEWMTLPSMIEATGAALRNADALLGQIRRLGT